MNNYGKSAIRAVELLQSKEIFFTDEAWKIATAEFFKTQPKVCARSAFLGLCEAGLVKGVTHSHIRHYLRNSTNKDHAVDAITLLSKNSFISYKPLELWRAIMQGNPKSHNFQMNVVLALWQRDMIVSLEESIALR